MSSGQVTPDSIDDIGNQSPDNPDDSDQNPTYLKAILTAVGFTISGLGLMTLYGLVFNGVYYLVTGEISRPNAMIMEMFASLCGMTTLAVILVKYTDRGWSYFDLDMPTIAETGLAIGTAIGLLVLSTGVSKLFELLGVSQSEHALVQLAESGQVEPAFFLLFIPLSIFLIGPAEELLFRNIVQKSLYDRFDKQQAAAVAGLLFATIHIPVYLTAGVGSAVASLSNVFLLGTILGLIYAYTDKLAVPAFSHGVYNATLFAMLYLGLSGAI